jgi:hypothetical protein
MRVRGAIGAAAALLFALSSLSDVVLAQGATRPKRPTVGAKPPVQVKPSAPKGCKLVGTVKGTKLWAGDCTAAPDLRTTTTPTLDDAAPTPPPEGTETVPKSKQ